MNMKRLALIPLAAVLFTANAQGQHQPYAGEHGRSIKALSEQEIQQYVAGAGMGYAKAAELNHFPGPMHILELGDKLGLSAEQRAATQRLMDSHKAEARAIGEKKLEAERGLDMLFRSGNVDEQSLADAVRTAATLEGEYRLSHLETHRRLRALLSDAQVKRYDELRGYGGQQHAR
jgi:hypothetical protein